MSITSVEVHEPQWPLYLFMMAVFLTWTSVLGRRAILLVLNRSKTGTRTLLWAKVVALLFISAVGLWGCVRTTLREGALHVEIGTEAARLQYRWSADTIRYEEVQSLTYRDAKHRRGLRIHETRVTTPNDTHRVWAISNDSQSVSAVQEVFEELSKHVPKERILTEVEK